MRKIKLIILTLSLLGLKPVVVPESMCDYKFVKHHKDNIIVTYTYGTRCCKNGKGLTKDGFYIKYPSGRAREKFTTFVFLEKGARDVDEIANRIDISGWHNCKKYFGGN